MVSSAGFSPFTSRMRRPSFATRKLIGPLDDLAPTISTLPRILVRPFVFLLDRPALLRLSDEVADAAWVDLEELLSPSVWGNHDVEARGVRFTRPGYRLPHGIVWGMTERILTPVLDLLRAESQPPVDF